MRARNHDSKGPGGAAPPDGGETGSFGLDAELLRLAGEVFNSDCDGIVIVDRKGTVIVVNQAFAELLDTTPQALVGKDVHQAYPNSQPSLLPVVMETGTPRIGITHYLNGKQVYASLFPLFKDGEVIGGIGKILFKDIREITLLANRLLAAPQDRGQGRSAAGSAAGLRYDVGSIVGESARIRELKEALLRVAPKNSNVLLLGESGTGKELFAHAIHAASARRSARFIKINCAAIPEHLLESELFGYAEGAFTGARKGGQTGKFEQADRGTIFLDEIGDMPLYMQAKLLRVLEERELTLLGGGAPRPIDVRVVAATNVNLEELVRQGKFREDLYYRLKVVTLDIPPLRERMEDLPPLIRLFISRFNAEFGLEVRDLDQDAWQIVTSYHWPGNIRELRNVMESAFNTVGGALITAAHLPDQLARLLPALAAPAAGAQRQALRELARQSLGTRNLGLLLEDFERMLVEEAVEASQGNKQKAARLLGISRQWLYKKLPKPSGPEGEPA